MSKHTPGPWIVVGSWIIEADQRSIGIARVARQCSDEQAGANALLLAAAPALAEALRDMLADQETMNEPYRNECLCENARAALKGAGIEE